jgi:fumarate reductase subunit C
MRRTAVALGVGLALLTLAVVLVFSRSPTTVAGTNSITTSDYSEIENGKLAACHPVGQVPAGTTAVRLSIEARAVGPSVAIKLISSSGTLSEGRRPAGWGTAPTVTVPIRKLSQALRSARACVSIGPSVEPLRVHGQRLPSAPVGANKLALLAPRMEYLRPETSSWWSQIAKTAKHLGVGRAAAGSWIVFLVLALMLAVVLISSRLLLRELP